MESPIHCKVVHSNNDIRRFLFAGRDYNSLKATIAKLFSLNHEFILKYLDDEGDYVNLDSQNDLNTALEISPNLIRIKIGNAHDPVSHWDGKRTRKERKRRHPKPDTEKGPRRHNRRSWAEKKLFFISECLKELSDDSKLTPRELKKKQRLLKKHQRLESFLSEGHYPKRERRVLTPEEQKLNSALKSQMLEIRTEAKKLKSRQRDLKLALQNNPGDKVIKDELDQLKEKKKQFKIQRRSLCEKLHSQ